MGEKRGRKEGGKRGAVCEKIHRWHSASAQRAWVRLADVYGATRHVSDTGTSQPANSEKNGKMSRGERSQM